MFTSLSPAVKAWIFVVGVLATSWATASIAGGLVLAISPLLMTLLMMFVITRDGYSRRGWQQMGFLRLGFRWWPVTLLVTAGVSALSYAVAVAVGAASPNGLAPTAGPDLLSLSISGPILAFAEEIGWRGYLQSHLREKTGQFWSWIIVGAVWVTWHLSYILLTPFYHADGDRTLVLSLFTANVLAFSVLFGVLRDVSGSMWVAVLAHFAHNAAFAWIGANVITAEDPIVVNEYVAGDTGAMVLLGTTVSAVALILYSRLRRRATLTTAPRSGK